MADANDNQGSRTSAMGRLNLAVIDDDADVAESLREVLQDLNCNVVAFTSSTEAAEHLNQQEYDAIFVDQNMPGMDGVTLVHHIRESRVNSKTPIAMISGIEDAATMTAGFDAGVTAFVAKPVTRERVQRVLVILRTVIG